MGSNKEIDIKNLTDLFFNDMINIEDFNLDKKSYKNIGYLLHWIHHN